LVTRSRRARNDWTTSDVSIVEVASGKVNGLAEHAGRRKFSRSTRRMEIDRGARQRQSARAGRKSGLIQIFPANGGRAEERGGVVRRSHPASPAGLPDGKRIYFAEPKGTGTQLYVVDCRREPH
jgi:hypothetical protein